MPEEFVVEDVIEVQIAALDSKTSVVVRSGSCFDLKDSVYIVLVAPEMLEEVIRRGAGVIEGDKQGSCTVLG